MMHMDSPLFASPSAPEVTEQNSDSESFSIYDIYGPAQRRLLTEISKDNSFPPITIIYNSQLAREKKIDFDTKQTPSVAQSFTKIPRSYRTSRDGDSCTSRFNRVVISTNVTCFRGKVTIRSPLLRRKKILDSSEEESATSFIENLRCFTLDLRKPRENYQAEARWRTNAKNLAVSLLRYKELYNVLQKKRMSSRRRRRNIASKSRAQNRISKNNSVSPDSSSSYSSVFIESAKNSPSMVKTVEEASVGRLLQGQMLHGTQATARLCMMGSDIRVSADSADMEK